MYYTIRFCLRSLVGPLVVIDIDPVEECLALLSTAFRGLRGVGFRVLVWICGLGFRGRPVPALASLSRISKILQGSRGSHEVLAGSTGFEDKILEQPRHKLRRNSCISHRTTLNLTP